MDVAQTGRINGRTVIFHHGGLYYGWYWEKQIAALAAQGYRVIMKDSRLGKIFKARDSSAVTCGHRTPDSWII